MSDRQASAGPQRSSTRAWVILAFWLMVIGGLYLVMNQLLKPAQAVYSTDGLGELQLPRHRDGHFYIQGSINGSPVNFMVDTGASIVSVSDQVAQAAGLSGGERSTFYTANGTREGRIVLADTLSLAGFELKGIRVGTGLDSGRDNTALLGQNVLSHFDVSISGSTMTMRPR